MIINSRLKCLVELDDVLRQAERAAARHGDPAAIAKHATAQNRAGHGPHDIMRPHVEHYVSAVRHRIDRTGHEDHKGALLAEKSATDNLHAAAGALGHHAGHFVDAWHSHQMQPEFLRSKPHITATEVRNNHLKRLAELHGSTWQGGFVWSPERRPHNNRAAFDNKSDAEAFKKSAEHHYPGHPIDHGTIKLNAQDKEQPDVRWR